MLTHERLTLTARTESGVLDRHQDRDRVAVVDRDQVDLFACAAGHVERSVGSGNQRSREHVFGIRRRLMQDALAESGNPGRTMLRASRDIRAGDNNRCATDAGHHDLEHVNRIGDHRRVEHVLDRDRDVMEDGCRIVIGRDPLIHSNLGQRLRVVAVFGAVLHRDLRIATVLRDVAIGNVKLSLRRPIVGRRRAVTPTTRPAGHDRRSGRGPRGRSNHRPRWQCPAQIAAAARQTIAAQEAPPRSTTSAKLTCIPRYSVIVEGTNESDSRIFVAQMPSTSDGSIPASSNASRVS